MGVYEKFADYYDLIYIGIVDYEKECDILRSIFEKFCIKKPKTLLDIGCGTGSHTIPFAKLGHNIAGIDISPSMIEKAKEKAEKKGVNAKFYVQDMRNLDLETRFDCAFCMFGAFGYLLTDEDLAHFLSGLSRHLNKDGIFVFEFWNIGGLKPSPYKSWMKAQDENLTVYRLSESNFDPTINVLNIDMNFIVVHTDRLAESFAEKHKIRCYKLSKIKKHLESNGFKPLVAYDWDTKNKSA
jgi:cyclopropane fatty-acyl-phospholipid synthase-like methyltransferase